MRTEVVPTKVITVRVRVALWDRFASICREAGMTPNKAINSFIASGSVTVKPATEKRPAKGHVPTGYDAITGEPIFKRGVGPQRGKI